MHFSINVKRYSVAQSNKMFMFVISCIAYAPQKDLNIQLTTEREYTGNLRKSKKTMKKRLKLTRPLFSQRVRGRLVFWELELNIVAKLHLHLFRSGRYTIFMKLCILLYNALSPDYKLLSKCKRCRSIRLSCNFVKYPEISFLTLHPMM